VGDTRASPLPPGPALPPGPPQPPGPAPSPVAAGAVPRSETGASGRPRRVLQTDVADLAGVSYQTVSRVLNLHPSVRPQTRERVLAAIQQLGYQPHPTGRALATGRTRTLGVIAFDATQFGSASTLDALNVAARQAGYMVFTVAIKSSDRGEIEGIVEQLAGHAVEGIITIAPSKALGRAIARVARTVPMVSLDDSFDDNIAVVTVDEAAGAALATQHLLELGHPTVWHIAGRIDSIAAEGRINGWQHALEAAGAAVPPPLLGGWDAGSGYAHGRELSARPDVSAVFAANDQMAVGLLRALHEAGRRVPADVSVVGFDDIPESAYLIPPLTTVRPDFAEMGRRCVALLIEQIERPVPHRDRSVVPARLVVRASTGRYTS
jgi:DNA-binding LacI/PurR family transcriptional regulator